MEMILMQKGNKQIQAASADIENMRAIGYRIVDKDGVIESLETERESVDRAEIESEIRAEYERKFLLCAMTDDELRQYADDNSIVIPGNVSKKETIVNLIVHHESQKDLPACPAGRPTGRRE
jgi:hypothetical protein